MCGGVFFIHASREHRVYFPNPKAQLPVRSRSGGNILVPWGRRKEQAGMLPFGGWARLDAIHAGSWDRWFPRPAKIMVSQFMENDFVGNTRWFDIPRGKWIQGLVAVHGHERRVYVVTIEPEMAVAETFYDRWPRILSG